MHYWAFNVHNHNYPHQSPLLGWASMGHTIKYCQKRRATSLRHFVETGSQKISD
jgi:hypothetical protein